MKARQGQITLFDDTYTAMETLCNNIRHEKQKQDRILKFNIKHIQKKLH